MVKHLQQSWGDYLWFASVWNPVAGKWVRVEQPVGDEEGDESRQFEEIEQPTAQVEAADSPPHQDGA